MAEERAGRPSIPDRFREFWQNTKRIVRVARRPTFQEVRLIARVSGIGILLVGAVAYLLQILGSFTSEFFKPETTSTGGALVVVLMHFAAHVAPAILRAGLNPALITMVVGITLAAIGNKK
ncbi:MAG: SecE/sec61-gamma family protein translocase subunit [Candidatus Sigynarchaeota archaeon]